MHIKCNLSSKNKIYNKNKINSQIRKQNANYSKINILNNQDNSSNFDFDTYEQVYSQSIANNQEDDEENVWFCKDKLLKDHLAEVACRWQELDDEIWCKLIVMEQNVRVAKAYSRLPIVFVDNSQDFYFSGSRLGLNSFYNSQRTPLGAYCLQKLDCGVCLKLDINANISVERLTDAPVFVRKFFSSKNNNNHIQTNHRYPLDANDSQITIVEQQLSGKEEESIRNNYKLVTNRNELISRRKLLQRQKEFLINQNKLIESSLVNNRSSVFVETRATLFDMNKFRAKLSQELRKPNPSKAKLEQSCVSILAFVADTENILELPLWIMVINIVGLELLEQQMPSFARISRFMRLKPHIVTTNDTNNYYDTEITNYPNVVSDDYSYDAIDSKKHLLHYYKIEDNYKQQNLNQKQNPPKLPPRHFASKHKQNTNYTIDNNIQLTSYSIGLDNKKSNINTQSLYKNDHFNTQSSGCDSNYTWEYLDSKPHGSNKKSTNNNCSNYSKLFKADDSWISASTLSSSHETFSSSSPRSTSTLNSTKHQHNRQQIYSANNLYQVSFLSRQVLRDKDKNKNKSLHPFYRHLSSDDLNAKHQVKPALNSLSN